MPRVSVVITFLDSELFLAEAIDSVLAQDYADWELLLIDDGSRDRSRWIAESYGLRLRVLAHPGGANLGISASRNLGVRHSQGEFIALLDSDDVWYPDKLRRQVALMDAHPEAAMVHSSAERWHSWNGSGTPDFIVRNAVWDTVAPPGAVLADYLRDESMAPCTCTALIRRDAFLACSGFCAEFTGLYDDQVFFAKLLLEYPAFIMTDVTARYRQHERSTCAIAREDGSGPTARLRFLTWLLEYLGPDHAQIRAIAEAELRQLTGSVLPSGQANRASR